jgi:hypothetical protein
MRIPQRPGDKGSLKWIQTLVASPERALNPAIRASMDLTPGVTIKWISPLVDDDYAEYRDADWLDRQNLAHLIPALGAFWPSNGPQWDALASVSDGKTLIVEAKSHPTEMISNCGAGPASREKIEQALEDAKRYYGAPPGADWTTSFYRYANRLAHLKFLREQGVDAHLVFVYFLNDFAMRGPDSLAEWVHAIDDCHEWLGLPRAIKDFGVHEVFIDVSRSTSTTADTADIPK